MTKEESPAVKAYWARYTRSDGSRMSTRERETYDTALANEVASVRQDEASMRRRADEASPKSKAAKKVAYLEEQMKTVFTRDDRAMIQRHLDAARQALAAEKAEAKQENEIASHPGTVAANEYLLGAPLSTEQRKRLEAVREVWGAEPELMHQRMAQLAEEFRQEDRQKAEKERSDAQIAHYKSNAEFYQQSADQMQREHAAEAAHVKLLEGASGDTGTT